MTKLALSAVAVATVMVMTLAAVPAVAQEAQIPGVAPARDVPNAKELPDPNTEYKVLFDAIEGAAKPTEVDGMLSATARYVNTLIKYGVPLSKRKIAVVFHGGGTPAIMTNEEYRKRNKGVDNPNIPLIQALKKAGVEFHVCGQAVLGWKIDQKDILPEIQVDLWALTTIIHLQQRGYVHIGG